MKKPNDSACLKRPDFRGIKFKFLMYFLGFAMIIVALVWLMQVAFLGAYYKVMKRAEVERISDYLVRNYGESDFETVVADTAFKNELDILVFTVEEGIAVGICASGGLGGHMQPPPVEINEFLNAFSEGSDSVSYINAARKGFETLTCGQRVNNDGKYIYFFMKASLSPVDSTTKVLTNQLIIITIISLGAAAVISYFVSKRMTKPIEEITRGTVRLAEGKFDTRLSVAGYSEIEQLSGSLNFAAEKLQKADNIKKDLIANVSHELRTPLTVIKAYSEMIMDISGGDKEKREQHLGIILRETDRLKDLVNDMLDISKLQAKETQLCEEIFDFSELVNETAREFTEIYSGEGFVFCVEAMREAMIKADKRRMKQVLSNFLSNAINYSEEDKSIRIVLADTGFHYRLDIIDNGKGIKESDIPFVFDKFFRAEKSKREKVGSGIGLSIVKGILEQHGFAYGVNSEEDKGSDFYVLIPKEKE